MCWLGIWNPNPFGRAMALGGSRCITSHWWYLPGFYLALLLVFLVGIRPTNVLLIAPPLYGSLDPVWSSNLPSSLSRDGTDDIGSSCVWSHADTDDTGSSCVGNHSGTVGLVPTCVPRCVETICFNTLASITSVPVGPLCSFECVAAMLLLFVKTIILWDALPNVCNSVEAVCNWITCSTFFTLPFIRFCTVFGAPDSSVIDWFDGLISDWFDGVYYGDYNLLYPTFRCFQYFHAAIPSGTGSFPTSGSLNKLLLVSRWLLFRVVALSCNSSFYGLTPCLLPSGLLYPFNFGFSLPVHENSALMSLFLFDPGPDNVAIFENSSWKHSLSGFIIPNDFVIDLSRVVTVFGDDNLVMVGEIDIILPFLCICSSCEPDNACWNLLWQLVPCFCIFVQSFFNSCLNGD